MIETVVLLTTCPNMSSRNFHNAVEIFDGSGCEAAEALCTNLQLVSSDSSAGLGGLRRIGDQLQKSTTLSRLTSTLKFRAV